MTSMNFLINLAHGTIENFELKWINSVFERVKGMDVM